MLNIINIFRKPEPLVPYKSARARKRLSSKEQEKNVSKLKEPLLEHKQTNFFGRPDKTNAVHLKDGPGRVFVVMSGAGQRFWAYLGFLQVLDEHGIPVHKYMGTSGGALAGLLAALEYNYEDVVKKLDGRMAYLFYDFDFRALLKLKNINRGKRLREYMKKSLPDGVRKFSQVSDFYAVASAVNIWARNEKDALEYRKLAPVVFGMEFTKDFPIVQGIYASMCLPNFEPVVVEKERVFYSVDENGKKIELVSGNEKVGLTYLVDGGYTSHKPVEVAVNLYNPEKDVILLITPTGDFNSLDVNLVNSFFSFPITVNMEERFNRKMKNFEDQNIMVVYLQDWLVGKYDIDITNISPYDFSKIRELYDAGKKAAERWIYHKIHL